MLFLKILPIFLIILLGFFARRKNFISLQTIKEISVAITRFFYPALIFSAFLKNFTAGQLIDGWQLPAGTLLLMFSGYLIGIFASKFIKFKDNKEKDTFRFQCTINNYSFLPMTVIIVLLGEAKISQLILSTFGSEISVWTFGILALTGNRLRKESFKNLLSVPMMAILFSVLLIFLRDKTGFTVSNQYLKVLSSSILISIDLLGKVTIPLALFIAGARMGEIKMKGILNLKNVFLIILRLFLIPAVAIVLFNLLKFEHDVKIILSIVAIMPTAIASIVLSEAYDGDSEYAAATTFLTHLISFFTIPLWLTILNI